MGSTAARVFPDTNVILGVVLIEQGLFEQAFAALYEGARRVVTSDLVRLEAMSRIWRHNRRGLGSTGRARLISDATAVFETFPQRAEIDAAIIRDALDITNLVPGIHAMDALHAATARSIGAEFLTFEATTKPLFFVPRLKVRSLLAGAPAQRVSHGSSP